MFSKESESIIKLSYCQTEIHISQGQMAPHSDARDVPWPGVRPRYERAGQDQIRQHHVGEHTKEQGERCFIDLSRHFFSRSNGIDVDCIEVYCGRLLSEIRIESSFFLIHSSRI